MPLAVIRSRALLGMVAPEVRVEAHLANGLPAFTIVGLPRAEVRESKDRVRAAILQLGFEFPNRRITVNLAPAELPKESGRFDLPIALGILCASGQLPPDLVEQYEAVGELSLSGAVRPVRGAIAMALAVRRAGQNRTLLLPHDNADEAALIGGLAFSAIHSLADAVLVLGGKLPDAQPPDVQPPGSNPPAGPTWPADCLPGPAPGPVAGSDRQNRHNRHDMADVCGQASVKRVLEIAASGGHSLLMVGPPGAGKSMLALRLPSILPPLDDDEACEVAALASLRGRFEPANWGERPFRAPHHSASVPALVGGGSVPRPGEISLAHRGVLFLDELPEFARPVLEALREPLENGQITVSRALRQLDFPARFQLVAAMNPCPCGYLGDRDGRCRCTIDQVRLYQGRLSGPLLDRIDLQVWVQALPSHQLFAPRDGEPSSLIGQRVQAARATQLRRQHQPNAQLPDRQLPTICALDPDGRRLLEGAAVTMELSGRAVNRALKVARSIADLAGNEHIQADHVGEALMYRSGFQPFKPANC